MAKEAATVLVTGVTGNVGEAAALHLIKRGTPVRGAVTSVERARERGAGPAELTRFDFLDPSTFPAALEGVSGVFLVRPPGIGDPSPLQSFIRAAKEAGVRHIVFLSMLGVERNLLPRHSRIEKYVMHSGIPYTFLRPNFFMQNLNTIHRDDICFRQDLFIPAGKAPVSFVDARDVGEAAAIVFADRASCANRAFTLTGGESLTHERAAELFTEALGRPVTYSNPSAGEFKKELLSRGLPKETINVIVALYFTAKLGLAKKMSPELETLLGRKPTTLEQYIRDYRDCWMQKDEGGFQ